MRCILNYIKKAAQSHIILQAVNNGKLRITKKGKVKKK
jgi:hypothetical protein